MNGNMWLGLNSLTRLDLQYNLQMQTILPGGLSNLPKLDLLHLHNNGLKTLSKDIFTINDCPDGHPPILRLTLRDNPLVCDTKLCWLKKGEEEGWLRFSDNHSPNCAYNVDWYNLKLNCTESGTSMKMIFLIISGSMLNSLPHATIFQSPTTVSCASAKKERTMKAMVTMITVVRIRNLLFRKTGI